MSILRWIEAHMNACLIIGCITGLVWPYWGAVPDKTVLALIMGATFLACFRLNTREFQRVPWTLVGRFYIVRFIIVPLAVYYLASLIFGASVALGLMLIAALPIGASAPAMTHVFGGQVALTAILTLATTLLAPFVMPLLFASVDTLGAHPPSAMFHTLLVALLLPCALFMHCRRYPTCHQFAHRYAKPLTILMISIMIAIVVGKNRHLVYAEPMVVFELTVLAYALLTLLLLVGWIAGSRLLVDQQIAFATASGFNNIGLGVGMALMHFSPTVVLVAIATEIAWAFLPAVMRFMRAS